MPASRHAGREGDPFIIASVPPHIRDQFPNQNGWVLDRMVVRAGTVVPQTLWAPPTDIDRRQHIEKAPLQMPIFLQHTDGRLGVPLDAAVAGRCHSLINAQSSAPLGPLATTYIRILWPGYVGVKRQVQIKDETPDRNTVTLSRFAQHLGRSVDAFLRNPQPDTENPVPKWGIGGIQPNEIIIIGAIQVSSGSWMPILQLNRYIL
jgi:hypothetical protein